MALGRAHYEKNGLCSREELNESSHLVMPLIEGLIKNRKKNFDWWDYPRNHKVDHLRQGLKKNGKILMEKREIGYPLGIWKIFCYGGRKEPFMKMEGMWHRCQFLELKFHFRMCHRNTLVNFWQGFFTVVGGGLERGWKRRERRGYVLTNFTRAS